MDTNWQLFMEIFLNSYNSEDEGIVFEDISEENSMYAIYFLLFVKYGWRGRSSAT